MRKLGITLILALCAILGALPLALQAQTPGQNLLVGGGFEAQKWPVQDEIASLQVAPGWRAWYLDIEQIPAYVAKPNNCPTPDLGCYWARPEYQAALADLNPNRVRSGAKAQKYYSYGRMHEGGLYQQVAGIQPETTLQFSIYMQAWMCYQIDACGKGGILSDAPSDMHLRIGIDPYGGADPFSANIVWSPEAPAFDQWVKFTVKAQAKSDTVTVFTHSRADWDWPRNNNDVYLDDADLVVVEKGQPSATVAPATLPGSPAPTQPPAATRTPRPDSAIVHVIRPGDSLYAISREYGVPLDELYRLNNLTRTSILSVGQEIVVKTPPGAAPGTAMPAATATRTTQARPTVTLPLTPTATATITSPLTPTATLARSTPTAAPPTATPAPQGLCLSAFDDLNGNTVRDGNEPGLAAVAFSILSGGSQVAQYASDSTSLPYCLTQLPPGEYTVLVQLPSGYVAPFDKTNLTLTQGQQVRLALGARKGEKPTPTPVPTVPAPPAPPTLGRSNATLIVLILIAAAILMLVTAAIIAIRRGR